jgi:lipoate-protein ligase A
MWIDDEIINRCEEELVVDAWVPETSYVVMGSGNDPLLECRTENCAADNIPLLRRYGGGGTVLLYPGCVVVGIGCWVHHAFQNDRYFRLLNQSIIKLLQDCWGGFDRLQQRGISDIAFGDKKICGTSMFRSRNYLLFQASLLIEPDVEAIATYLAHPSKEPDYRQGKNHGLFLTSLAEIVPGLNAMTVADRFRSRLSWQVRELLVDDLCPPDPQQIVHMKKRASRAGPKS